VSVRIGLTLPSFVEDPEVALVVAQRAEAVGIDAVFVYDHLFRDSPERGGARRPALEAFTLLGALAAETRTVLLGTLVARASLRPPAMLAHAFDTVQRVSNGRVIAGIGAGDSVSRAENEQFGLEFGTMSDRVDALHDAVHATRRRGYPVWVGGRVAQVRELVALADGWNEWGSDVGSFVEHRELVREVAPDAAITWGGVVTFRDQRPEDIAERLRPYAEAGADWVIVGPYDAANPDNATVLGNEVMPRLRRRGSA
jgi:alkanesulfonate monooxygenase SsuD/methylene tetrahydromethanopterin reductase-like flavin-dependent oxidoreductase (luciferase family)